LQNADHYRLVGELEMNNPHPFFNEHAKGSWLVTAFFVLLAGGLGLMISMNFIQAWKQPGMLWQVATAIALVFVVLLPIHEGIHALAYKSLGAKNVQFSFTWRKLAVYTCAPRFVIRLKEIIPLAIAPFLVITLVLSALFYLSPCLRPLFLWSLWIHSAFCGGDIILIAYAIRNQKKDLYNYDDLEAGKSYFYERTNP
jgi:hypothetical protein